MTKDELSAKSVEDLREIAEHLGIKVHHKAKAETIIYQILQQPTARVEQSMNHPSQHAVDPVITNSEDDIREAIKAFTNKEGYQVNFPGDGTWHFKYKGTEDTGNMAIPLRSIVMKAEIVSRGAFRPRGYGSDAGFDNAVSLGYSNTVLM